MHHLASSLATVVRLAGRQTRFGKVFSKFNITVYVYDFTAVSNNTAQQYCLQYSTAVLFK